MRNSFSLEFELRCAPAELRAQSFASAYTAFRDEYKGGLEFCSVLPGAVYSTNLTISPSQWGGGHIASWLKASVDTAGLASVTT
jgi:hypothetical protein